MELEKQLTWLTKIVEEGNLTAAAKKLYVSQPYLSQQLNQLEEELEVQLFNRLHRSMEITLAGKEYLKYLQQHAELRHNLQTKLDMITKGIYGTIRIGIHLSLGESLLPAVLPVFVDQHPSIRVELVEATANQLEHMLEQGIIDVALGMLPIESPALTYLPIYEEDTYLFIPKRSPFYQPEFNTVCEFPHDINMLSEIRLILLTPEHALRRLVDQLYTLYDLEQNIGYTTSSIYTTIKLARQGAGCTFVFATGMSDISFDDSNIFYFKNNLLQTHFVIYYHKNRILPEYVHDFIHLARTKLKDESKKFRARSFNNDSSRGEYPRLRRL